MWRLIQWVFAVECKAFSVSNGKGEAVGRYSHEGDKRDEMIVILNLNVQEKKAGLTLKTQKTTVKTKITS